MNRYLKPALVSLLGASLFAGGAFASSKDRGPDPIERQQIDQNTTGSVNTDSFMTNDNVGAWQTGKINVVVVSTLNDVDPNKTLLQDRMKTNPDEVAALQAAIQNNSALRSQLEAQNVQLENVVAAVQSADGDVTFYVK